MKSDHSLKILEKKGGELYELPGSMQGGRTRKADVWGGWQAELEPPAWRALNLATSEHPAGLWEPCAKLADSKLNLDLLLQTLFWTTGLSDKRKWV